VNGVLAAVVSSALGVGVAAVAGGIWLASSAPGAR
jgi:hypothetical protein